MLIDTMTYPEINITAQIWRELKHISGNIARKGWRPAFCWVGVYIPLWAYVVAPQQGIHIDLGQVNLFASTVLGAFVMRGIEKLKGQP